MKLSFFKYFYHSPKRSKRRRFMQPDPSLVHRKAIKADPKRKRNRRWTNIREAKREKQLKEISRCDLIIGRSYRSLCTNGGSSSSSRRNWRESAPFPMKSKVRSTALPAVEERS